MAAETKTEVKKDDGDATDKKKPKEEEEPELVFFTFCF